MDFEFGTPPPLIQEKKKYATFTVTDIGGPEDIVKWREMQAAKETTYRLQLGERDNRVRQFERETRQVLESPKITKASWAEKVKFAESERVRLAQAEKAVTDYPPWIPHEEPPKPFFTKVKDFFGRIWKSANFN